MLWWATSCAIKFPISRDPPEGGTPKLIIKEIGGRSFQFLGIPPKGELYIPYFKNRIQFTKFPISRDPPEGGT